MAQAKGVTQITLYVDREMKKKIEAEGMRRRRKLGPTVLEILIEYFERGSNAAQTPKTGD